jgi:cobalt-zinc-cadmium efflux system membrane fusion protein
MQSNIVTTSLCLVGFLAISTFILQGCNSEADKKTAEKQQYVIPDSLFKTLEIDTVKNCQVIDAITLTGKVAFNDDNVVKIYPMVSGNIQGIKVMLGDYVHQGDILATIRSSEMAGLSSDLTNAETNLRVAKKNLDATQDMTNSGLSSQKDLLSAQAGYAQAKSELARVNEVLKINGGNTQGSYIIRAPINGFVVEKLVTNSMLIRADNSTNLFTISDLKTVWVMANVYESNIGDVHLNDNVDITTLSYPGKVFSGKVDKILNILDPTNKVMKVRIVLPNNDYALKPEMFTNVTVTSRENKHTLCIPSTALVFDHSQYYALVYKSAADVRIVPVEVVNTVDGKSYISSGLTEGDIIIGSQVILIYDALNS